MEFLFGKPKEEEVLDLRLQAEVMASMVVRKDLGRGVVKFTIPDEIFNNHKTITVRGKEYGIYEVPGVEDFAAPKIIESVIEKFIEEEGAPVWSQVILGPQFEANGEIAGFPKTVYLRK